MKPATSRLDALLGEAERTNQWLADKVKVSKPTVSNWRRGHRIPDHRLEEIAGVFARDLGRHVEPEEVWS